MRAGGQHVLHNICHAACRTQTALRAWTGRNGSGCSLQSSGCRDEHNSSKSEQARVAERMLYKGCSTECKMLKETAGPNLRRWR